MPDLTEDIESSETKHPSKLLKLAVLLLSVAAVTAPILIERTMLYDEYGINKNAFLTNLALPAVWSVVTLLAIALIVKTRVAGDLDIVWYRWSRSEVMRAFFLILVTPLVYYPTALLMHKLGLPLKEDLYFWADQKGLAFFITLTVFITIMIPILEELFWRVYVFGTLRHIFGGLTAWLGQAAIFGVIHFRPFGGFVPVFFFGLIAGAWRWRRRTLVPIILAHIVVNSLWCAARWPDWLDCTRIRNSVDYVARYEAIAGIANLDPNDNARNLYELARQSAVAVPSEFEQVKNLWTVDWSAEQHAAMSDWLSDNEKMLDYVEQGTKKPYYWPGLNGDIMTTAMPELAWVRISAYALRTRSQLYATEGNLEPAFSDLVTCLRLANHIASRRPIISQLVAFSIRDVAVGSAFRILKNTDVPPETLEHFQRRIEQSLAEDMHTIDFEVERLIFLHEIQLMFTDDGAGNKHVPKIALRIPRTFQSLLPEFTAQQKQALLKLDRRRTTILANRFFDLLDEAAKMSAWQFQNNAIGIKIELKGIITQNVFISDFGSVYIKLLVTASRTSTAMEGLIGTIAILRYQAERGQLPSSLQTLVDEGYLEALPQDSFSDNPLIYEQTADGFLLYSCGQDFDDDGGVTSNWGKDEKGDDQVFWPVEESSYQN